MLSWQSASLAAAIFCAAMSTGGSSRAAPPDGTLRYAITRNGSNIGTHTIRIQHTDAGVVVEHKVRVSVKVLFVQAYRYDADRTETWKDDRLVAFKAHTNDNGDPIDVSARSVDAGIQVQGSKGTVTVPAETVLAGAGYNLLERHPTQM